MRIDLRGRRAVLAGRRNAVAEAASAALAENGAMVSFDEAADDADLLVLVHALDLEPGYRPEPLIALADRAADAMLAKGGGRILHVLPAAAALPMRRHAEASRALAPVVAAVRGLAMQAAPAVLVNALATGWLDEGSGDPAMGTHVPLGRAGRIEEAIAALLFLADPMNSYTTGQLLTVDGGWSAGYGRDF